MSFHVQNIQSLTYPKTAKQRFEEAKGFDEYEFEISEKEQWLTDLAYKSWPERLDTHLAREILELENIAMVHATEEEIKALSKS